MNKAREDILNTLDDWTVYIQKEDIMPYVTFKQDSPIKNILVQSECFDEEDLRSYSERGFCIFSSRQVTLVSEFLKRVGVGKMENRDTNWWLSLLVKNTED